MARCGWHPIEDVRMVQIRKPRVLVLFMCVFVVWLVFQADACSPRCGCLYNPASRPTPPPPLLAPALEAG
jgi:hypothetical protein